MIGRGAVLLICLSGVGIVSLRSTGAAAQSQDSLKERLHSSDDGSSLESANLKPWHLKLAVQLFDEKGQPTESGSIEEWWKSPGVYRRVYTTKLYTSTEIRNGDKFFRTTGAGSPPYYLDLLREQAVHPMPKANEIDESKPELRKGQSGNVPLECIMLTQPINGGAAPLGLFPTYCFDPGKDTLRISFDFGGQTVLRNKIGTFQAKAVATDISVKSENFQVAAGQVVTLMTEPISEDILIPGEGVIEQPSGYVGTPGSVMAGMRVFHPDPIYPASAKANHIQGKIVLHAIIGTDGHIHSLRLAPTPVPPDRDLAISSIASVRRWVYKPYILNGNPVDVDTTITVSFTFNRY